MIKNYFQFFFFIKSNVDSREGEAATLTGWGSSRENEQPDYNLRQNQVTVFPQRKCNETRTVINEDGEELSESPVLPRLFQSDVICAGYEGGIRNSCHGDSGGPLVRLEHPESGLSHHVQIGVVSGGKCRQIEKPSIYVRLEDYSVLNFIFRNAFNRHIPYQNCKFFFLS